MEDKMNRQDIKTIIGRLAQLELKDEFDQCCIYSAIDFLEELGNLVHSLEEQNKTQKEYFKTVFDDCANRIKKLTEENTKLKQDVLQLKHEIIHLEAIIDD